MAGWAEGSWWGKVWRGARDYGEFRGIQAVSKIMPTAGLVTNPI
jgi:hypothetical protein